MKTQWYKRLICYVFIAILFASGMQVNIDESHSYFACDSKSTAETQQYSNTQTFISSEYCTVELLQGRTAQFLRNASSRNHITRRIHTFSPIVSYLLRQAQYYFESQQRVELLCSTSCQTVIIEYIHRQDGSK